MKETTYLLALFSFKCCLIILTNQIMRSCLSVWRIRIFKVFYLLLTFLIVGTFVAYILYIFINPIQDGPCWGCSWTVTPLPKICHTYPTTVKLGKVIPYLKKSHWIYKLCDTLTEFCWPQFHRKSALLTISRNTDLDSILMYNF